MWPNKREDVHLRRRSAGLKPQHELLGHHWSCEKMLGAFPLHAGKTATRLLASGSPFNVALLPSADKTLHSAYTAQRRL
jgi:hypothetical protein